MCFVFSLLDYRYWDDPSDEFRDEEGTLLPLWKFTYDKTKKNTVTDISWNPYYYDLFSVCFGFRKYKFFITTFQIITGYG